MTVAASMFGCLLAAAGVAVQPIELREVERLPLAAAAVADGAQAIDLKTPQNAVKALTVAVANRSDRAGTYRVAVEGLAGFPAGNRRAFRLMATAAEADDVRSAPFVEMDESRTVAISAGEAGVVRFEFDAADVLPRTYRGALAVVRIDRTEPPVRVPVSLAIEPRRLPELPADALVLSKPAADERTFRLACSLGFRTAALDPKLFHFGRGANGEFDMSLYPPALVRLEGALANHRKWADACGADFLWLVAGDCRAAVRELYGLADGTDEEKRVWSAWLAAAEFRLGCFGFAKGTHAFGPRTPSVRKTVDPDSLANRTLGVACPNVRAALLRDEIAALREAAAARPKRSGSPETADVVVYGATSAGIAAAVAARRMGLSCTVVEPTRRIGGLTTGGLGCTDVGNKGAFGGLARRFYRDVWSHYADPASWTRQRREAYSNRGQSKTEADEEAMWAFEPSVALAILESWEKTEDLAIVRGERLDRSAGGIEVREVELGGGRQRRIVSFATESGRVFAGKVFVDATYEGDLLAAAGVSYTVGREANAVYGETLNGIQRGEARYHQFAPGVSAYVREGDPASGFLPGLARDVAEPDGSGDRRVQAYCFRMCLTDDPENRIPFKKPADWRESDYELLFRNLAAAARTGKRLRLPWINTPMPNRKTDANNRTGFSTDLIGGNWNYPEASYAERAEIERAHLAYQRGLMWTLANHPRVPEAVRAEVSRWGTCRDEFAGERGDGWQNQLYVREGRRMVGAYVMTEAHCRGKLRSRHAVALAAYQMDSHHVRRYADADGFVRNEGDVEVHRDEDGEKFAPYPIDYGALVPKRGECANLLVPVCLSASHIAFGSIRMEPVFFALGQAAGTAAALCAGRGCAVQDLRYADLRRRLQADGQRL